MNKSNDANLEYNKFLSELKKNSKISECFYHVKSECKGKIKRSHSIQRNGRLSIIEDNVDGNKKVYTFTSSVANEYTPFASLKPIGKSEASTFFGFCDYHDSYLFSAIENNQFDDSDKHCFLHSYRSFAHSYHKKRQELKGWINNNELDAERRASFIFSTQVSIKDGEIYKKELDRMIENQIYDELEYFTFIIPDLHPIACSSVINPPFFANGESFNNHADIDKPYSDIMFTILPDFNQTIVIFGVFPNDNGGIKYLDQLSELNDYNLKKMINWILINCAENTFFSPKLWNALGKKGQKILCHNLFLSADYNYNPTKLTFPEVNLLASSYTYDKLNI